MSWQKKKRKASFRGVEFFVDTHTAKHGRRVVNHEFPLREEPYSEDLGRKQREFSVTGYIIGTEYFAVRDALIEACEAKGSGQLVHPYYGTRLVVCEDLSLTESRMDGGYVSFTADFKEAGSKASPSSTTDPLSRVQGASSLAKASLSKDFLGFDIIGAPAFVISSARDMVEGLSDKMGSIKAGSGDPIGLADFSFAVRNLKANAADLARMPSQFVDSFQGSLDLLKGTLSLQGLLPTDNKGQVVSRADSRLLTINEDRAKRSTYAPLIGIKNGLPATTDTTEARRLEARNQVLFTRLVVGSALADLAEVAVETSYATSEEALSQRELLLDQLETLLLDETISDDSYAALEDLKSSIIEGLPDPSADLPRISRVALTGSEPSLVLAYRLYGTLDLESDIILRNGIKNPAFLPFGAELEVIANG